MTEPLACGHQEPPDGVAVLVFESSAPGAWELRLRFCLDCAVRVGAALTAGDWGWELDGPFAALLDARPVPRRPPVQPPAASAEQH